MVWDLRGALLKKGEFETARLLDFEFRLRARSMKLLAPMIGRDPDDLVARIALQGDEALLTGLLAETDLTAEDLQARWADAVIEARRQLIAELGDPTPYRLG